MPNFGMFANNLAELVGRKVGVARFAMKGAGYGMKAARGIARYGASGYYGGRGTAGYLAGGPIFQGGVALGNALSKANRYIGNNISTVNKYGGYAIGALGTAAAGRIGYTVLNSNSNRRRY